MWNFHPKIRSLSEVTAITNLTECLKKPHLNSKFTTIALKTLFWAVLKGIMQQCSPTGRQEVSLLLFQAAKLILWGQTRQLWAAMNRA